MHSVPFVNSLGEGVKRIKLLSRTAIAAIGVEITNNLYVRTLTPISQCTVGRHQRPNNFTVHCFFSLRFVGFNRPRFDPEQLTSPP